MIRSNVFEIIVNAKRTPGRVGWWDPVWRVLAWLSTPTEGHGIGAGFLRELTEFALGLPQDQAEAETEFKIEPLEPGAKEHWPDLIVAVPSVTAADAVLVFEDVRPNDAKKAARLPSYLKAVRQRFPKARVVVVALTDRANASSEWLRAEMLRLMPEEPAETWQVLTLTTTARWLLPHQAVASLDGRPLLTAWIEWVRSLG